MQDYVINRSCDWRTLCDWRSQNPNPYVINAEQYVLLCPDCLTPRRICSLGTRLASLLIVIASMQLRLSLVPRPHTKRSSVWRKWHGFLGFETGSNSTRIKRIREEKVCAPIKSRCISLLTHSYIIAGDTMADFTVPRLGSSYPTCDVKLAILSAAQAMATIVPLRNRVQLSKRVGSLCVLP